jgi:hypothetical protein
MSAETRDETFSPDKFRANLADAVVLGTSDVPEPDAKFRELEMWVSSRRYRSWP